MGWNLFTTFDLFASLFLNDTGSRILYQPPS
jgi:hypothetical protein